MILHFVENCFRYSTNLPALKAPERKKERKEEE